VPLVLQEQPARQVRKARPVPMVSQARQVQEPQVLPALRAIPVQVAELQVLQVRVV
jgi:hypothetical protein